MLRIAFKKSLELQLDGVECTTARREALQKAGQRLMRHLQNAPATPEGVLPSLSQHATLAAQLQAAISELTEALQDR